MSINAVKGVEIGAGFAAAALCGEENADEMRMQDGKPDSCPTMPAASWAAFRPARRSWPACGQADQLDPVAAQHRHSATRPRSHQRPPRSLRRHPRRAGGGSDDGLCAGRSPAAPPRSMRLNLDLSCSSGPRASRSLMLMSEVKSRTGAVWAASASLRFPSPLIKPDVRISRIRLTDWLHLMALGKPP